MFLRLFSRNSQANMATACSSMLKVKSQVENISFSLSLFLEKGRTTEANRVALERNINRYYICRPNTAVGPQWGARLVWSFGGTVCNIFAARLNVCTVCVAATCNETARKVARGQRGVSKHCVAPVLTQLNPIPIPWPGLRIECYIQSHVRV